MEATYNFSGKSAVVIGGTTGIGRATALAFAEAGANQYVAGLGASDGKEPGRGDHETVSEGSSRIR